MVGALGAIVGVSANEHACSFVHSKTHCMTSKRGRNVRGPNLAKGQRAPSFAHLANSPLNHESQRIADEGALYAEIASRSLW